ncbi:MULTISPECIES: HlyD family secretion protein [unclassified Shewanella]|uniref:HlyD family secretion protein n=1 Tax=unclassified Shewanella TaxID=196818 RepID=UPI000C84E0FB|nr:MULTISPECIES: HlyD family secretion protein [unclassified Shewanella]MDO6777527.1 HlyD family secretion protein [Shewanella sp. 3_MG-2023]PMG29891.1 hemolysin D [Shewanella sp. 10N.286.52.C2]PMG49956.1 hemolysin D [Shewanella sp. 10N.286.52.B9]
MTPDQQFSRLTKIALAGFMLVFGYFMFADAAMPLTPQAMATRVVTKVTPQVNGRIKTIAVTNNQVVSKGELLFEVDPRPYKLAVDEAQLALEQVQQDNAELDASLLAAQADVNASQTTSQQKRSEAKRLDALYKTNGVSQQQRDQADSDAAAAEANLLATQARLKQLEVSRGVYGNNNLKVRQAENRLAQAKLNLSYTQVHADQDGTVTNLQIMVGGFAAIGQPLLALVSDDVDIIADFREKALRDVSISSKALVAFDGEPGRLYRAHVSSIDAGVSAGQFDANGSLATPQQSDRWVRDAQRMRLHLQLDNDEVMRTLPTGARATVQIMPENSLLNLLAHGQIKAISMLHYIY